MKVLNLYAGIGGNRKLWKDVEVTAVEYNEEIAAIYQEYDLFYAYKNMVNAQAHNERILKSTKVGDKAKNFIRVMQTRLNVNIRDLRLLLPPSETKIIDEQMLDTEVSMQMQNINDMCAELPKAIRDQVENYIESYHKVYKQKVA